MYVSELRVFDNPHRDGQRWTWDQIRTLISEKNCNPTYKVYIDYFQSGINGIKKTCEYDESYNVQSRGLQHGLDARDKLPFTLEKINPEWRIISVDRDGITTHEGMLKWSEVMSIYLTKPKKFEFLRGIYDFLHDNIIEPNEDNCNLVMYDSPYLQGLYVGRSTCGLKGSCIDKKKKSAEVDVGDIRI